MERDRALYFPWSRIPDLRDRVPGVWCGRRQIQNAVGGIMTVAFLESLKDPERFISYSRARDWHDTNKSLARTPFNYRTTKGAVDRLAAEGLLEHIKTPAGYRGTQSRFRASQALMDAIGAPVVLFEPPPPLIIRDDNRAPGRVPVTPETRQMRADILAQREMLDTTTIGMQGPGITIRNGIAMSDGHGVLLGQKSPVRIFSRGSIKACGRIYYIGVQNARKRDREYITINGSPTVELDYSNMHAVMLYGYRPAFDPYVIDGPFSREDGKKAFNTKVNARTPQDAKNSLHKYLADKAGEPLSPEWYAKACQLDKAIEDRNREIAETAFGSDRGVYLQRKDSDIANAVIMAGVKAGIPMLGVHDSFIVEAQNQDFLRDQMAQKLHQFAGVR